MGVSHHRFHLEIFFLCKCAFPYPRNHAFSDILDRVEDGMWCRQPLRKLKFVWKPQILCQDRLETCHIIFKKNCFWYSCHTNDRGTITARLFSSFNSFTPQNRFLIEHCCEVTKATFISILVNFFALMEPLLVFDSLPFSMLVQEDRNLALLH